MFFSTRREKKQAERQQTEHETADALRAAFATAEATPDIGEKLIRLDELKEDLAKKLQKYKSERGFGEGAALTAFFSAIGAGSGVGFGTSLGIAKAAAVLSVAVPGAAAALVPFGVGFAAFVGTARLADHYLGGRHAAAYDARHRALLDVCNELMPKVAALHQEALGHSPQEFAASKIFDTLYDRFPALKDRFVKEAFRKDSVPERLSQPAQPAPAAPDAGKARGLRL